MPCFLQKLNELIAKGELNKKKTSVFIKVLVLSMNGFFKFFINKLSIIPSKKKSGNILLPDLTLKRKGNINYEF
ncbi:hypothetical protein C1631_010790 [Chryseobacterium phosphatilyticum]|uniref:Uncharacterized protein n=1 Tax=Chryseobacterium phosphatilyticum TaxID=475075 RepID=A0A316X9F3_9FLAO|nr:hypothetical protein C1631_010790 [Chryseobacterium phosphatilyticum]